MNAEVRPFYQKGFKSLLHELAEIDGRDRFDILKAGLPSMCRAESIEQMSSSSNLGCLQITKELTAAGQYQSAEPKFRAVYADVVSTSAKGSGVFTDPKQAISYLNSLVLMQYPTWKLELAKVRERIAVCFDYPLSTGDDVRFKELAFCRGKYIQLSAISGEVESATKDLKDLIDADSERRLGFEIAQTARVVEESARAFKMSF